MPLEGGVNVGVRRFLNPVGKKRNVWKTPQEYVLALITRVEGLVASGVINRGQGNALKALLQNAIRQLDRSKCDAAINQLQAFINLVNGFVESGVLPESSGQSLSNEANYIINLINDQREDLNC